MLSASLEALRSVWLEPERTLEKPPALLRIECVGTHGVEALERQLCRDLRMLGDEWLVLGLHDGQLQIETLGIGEEEPRVLAGDIDALCSEALLPEIQRFGRCNSPDDTVNHAGSRPPGTGSGILEKGDVRAGVALLVSVEEMVDGGVVLVDALFHQPQPQDPRVEIDVPGRIRRDASDVVDPLQPHGENGTCSSSCYPATAVRRASCESQLPSAAY